MKVHLLFISVFGLVFSQHLDKDHRIDCEPDRDKGGSNCANRGCIEDPDSSGEQGVPSCYFPPNTGYLAPNLGSPDDKVIHLQKDPKSVKNPFQTDFNDLDFTWSELGSAVHLKITPTNQTRYRPPVPIDDSTPITSSEKLVVKSSNNPIFSFTVVRQSTGEKVWDTSIGGLLFADQYIQIATLLSTDRIYGFGEHVHHTLKHDFDGYYSYAMFARDEPPDSLLPHNGKNLYGVQNFYMGVSNDGKAHGVFFFNSNAQEVTTASAPSLVYRTIGGFLEFFFFPGPTPEDVVRQYTQLVGRPFLPPYWGLGFQLCRYGYMSTNEIRDTLRRMREARIPQDVQFSDIDYMDDFKDFSYSPTNFGDFPQLADELHNNYSMHLTLIFDPAIEADYDVIQRGLAQDAKFVEWPSFDFVPQGLESQFPLLNGTKIMLGKVWPKRAAAFPDFLDPQGKTQKWWSDEFTRFRQKLAFDGAWIDMNEPSNFDTTGIKPSDPDATVLVCPTTGEGSRWDNPPYATKAAFDYGPLEYLFSRTICLLGTTARNTSLVYDTKNLYGWSESVATFSAVRAATGKRGYVLSRSTFASSGRYAGHWLGDNFSAWDDLQTSIVGIQEFNIFGIPYVGADICGFVGLPTEELCLRWQQLGAFYSFSRNHNDKDYPPQDPAQWPTVAAATKKANEFRYRHLPYLYSLHYRASLYGGTVVRPVFFEFVNDPVAYTISHQFLWGPAMIIAPVVKEGEVSVDVYLPQESKWYSMYDSYYGVAQTNGNSTYPAPWTSLIPVFIRGGYILPRQASALTTVLARKNRFELVVALDSSNSASGEFFWDDGDSIPSDDLSTHNFCHFTFDFKADNDSGATLTIVKTKSCTDITFPYLENIEVFGYPFYPDLPKATVNGNPVTLDSYDYSPFTNIVNITGKGLINYNVGSNWVLNFICVFGLVFSQHLDKDHRIDCEPDRDKTSSTCANRGCIEDPDSSGEQGVPSCYFPPNTGYLAPNLGSPDDKIIHLQKDPKSVKNPFQTDFNDLDFTWSELGSAVHLKITPTNQTRYRPPVPIDDSTPITSSEKLVVKSSNNPIFSFTVVRQSTGEKVWDTSIGGLLFADQYIQIATLLSTDRIYGFGEQVHHTLKHQFDGYYTYAMFAKDQGPDSSTLHNGKNLYGVQTLYMGVANDGKAHGVFFFNSNAQEVTTASAPSLVYRTIGGFLEFFLFPGPTPEDVVRQYTQLVGRPFLPPYWGLGFHLSRYGYTSTNEIRDTVERTRKAGIPQDVQFCDIDYMDRFKDFTYNLANFGDFPQLADELHNNYSIHLMLNVDPAIEADYDVMQRGLAQDATFVEWPSSEYVPQGLESQFPLLNGTKIMLGKVWPDRAVAFPDFLDPQEKTQKWWSDEFTRFRQKLAFDTAMIDMNEPANFDTNITQPSDPSTTILICPTTGDASKWDNPPYATASSFLYGPDEYIFTKTLCMFGTTIRNSSLVYNTKSLYGWSESRATFLAVRAATGKRGYVVSRSTFASSGKYAGHWLGDISSKWGDLQTSIVGIQEFNIFGIPYVGSDICGYRENTTEELCLRWQQLGAFYTFSRNHNRIDLILQDPAQWPTVAAATKKANEFRYRHLPYLYSLHYNVSLHGGTVVRPIFFEFPEDPLVYSINYQFLWGPAMMIVPVVYQGVTTVDAYLPPKSKWYSMYDSYYGVAQTNGNSTYPAPWTSLIPVFIRGGYILPRQASALTTVLARKNRFELVVALDSSNSASGEFFWDDGDSIPSDDLSTHNFCHFTFDFKADNDSGATLTIVKTKSCTDITFPYLENIEVFGYPFYPDLPKATVNGNPVTLDSYDYSPFTNIVNITGKGLIDYNTGSNWALKWPNRQSFNLL